MARQHTVSSNLVIAGLLLSVGVPTVSGCDAFKPKAEDAADGETPKAADEAPAAAEVEAEDNTGGKVDDKAEDKAEGNAEDNAEDKAEDKAVPETADATGTTDAGDAGGAGESGAEEADAAAEAGADTKTATETVTEGGTTFDAAKALSAALGKPVKLDSLAISSEMLDEPAEDVGTFKVGDEELQAKWFVATASGESVAVVLYTAPSKEEIYEAIFSRASTFVMRDGAWSHVKSEPFREKAKGDYASIPQLLELGADSFAIVYAPAIQGCGAGRCKPADSYVQTSIHEMTVEGLVSRVRFKGPACMVASGPPAMAGCTVSVVGASDKTRGIVKFAAKDKPSAKMVEANYKFNGESYGPVK